VHTFTSLTSKPTTLAGYGITDAAGASHTHAFSSLTSIPTTVSGYGITDVYTKTQSDGRYLQSYTETDPGVSSIIKNIPVSADAATNKYLNWNGSAYVRAQVAYSQVSGTPDLSGYQLTSNLSTVTTLGSSNTLYPSQLAVKTYVDNAVTAGGGYTDENAQDAIGTILSSEFTYSDATPSISINVIAASKITQDATHRFTTDAEKSTWNSKQDGDADLTTIAGLTATTNNFIVSVSSAWASRTPAQVKTTLSLDNVDNTSDATKNSATATLTNKRIICTDWNYSIIFDANTGR
jgi:hypothetical protein